MYRDLKEDWSYNEWPEVDLDGRVLRKTSKKLTESCEGPDCEKKEEPEENQFRDLVDEEGNELYEAKKDEESDFNVVVKDALDAIIPEDEDFEIETLADAVLNYFDEDVKDYMRSMLCPDDEEVEDAEIEEISEEEPIEESCKLKESKYNGKRGK